MRGRRVGPIQLRGPHLGNAFAHLARPKDVSTLEQAPRANTRTLPLDLLTRRAANQLDRVADFLADHSPAGTTAVHLPEEGEFG